MITVSGIDHSDAAKYTGEKDAHPKLEETRSSEDEESSVGAFSSGASNSKEMSRIYRKLDARIIPALWCLYFLTSFGSSAYGNTLTMNRLQGHSLSQSLKIHGKQLSTASALDSVGYIIFDVPMNLIMTKVSPQTWLSRIVITVGLVYTCYAALESSAALQACRFISGLVGAGTWPGLSYYVSLWYPNDRSTRRIGYYFTAAQISAAAAGLVAAGVQKLDGHHGYYGWQWMYLIYGSITMVVGILLLWWLPDRPFREMNDENSSWIVRTFHRITHTPHPLSERERELHKNDLSPRYQMVQWTWKDVMLVFTDLRMWPFVMMYFGVVGTGFGLAVFGTTIISVSNPSLSSISVSLLYAPIWLFDLGGILIMTPFADRNKKMRPVIFCFASSIIISGLFTMTFAHGSWNRYAGLLIAGFGLGPTVPICMSWSSEIFARRYGDVGAAVSAALVSGLGNLGSVTATYALYSGWPADEARLFRNSNMMLVLLCGVSMIACVISYFIADKVRQN